MDYNVWQTCLLVPNVSASNCAGWVQAWGSLIGLLIAIAVPTAMRYHEIGIRRAQERTFAIISAATAAAQVAQILAVLGSLRKDVDKVIAGREASMNLKAFAIFTTDLSHSTPTEDSLKAIALISPDCATMLARGKVQIEALRQMGGGFNKILEDGKRVDRDGALLVRPILVMAEQYFEIAEKLLPELFPDLPRDLPCP